MRRVMITDTAVTCKKDQVQISGSRPSPRKKIGEVFGFSDEDSTFMSVISQGEHILVNVVVNKIKSIIISLSMCNRLF